MLPVLEQIELIRQKPIESMDYDITNRYCVKVNENNGAKTVYYFSTPIYYRNTGNIIDSKFHCVDKKIYFFGSNAKVTLSNAIKLENDDGSLRISLNQPAEFIDTGKAKNGENFIYTTTNGIAYKVMCNNDEPFSFEINVSKPFMKERYNNKYFALMKNKFEPFMTVSVIGLLNSNDEVIAPAKISYRKSTDKRYILSVSPCNEESGYVMLEINMYEHKLFQDTTVESNTPTINNAFGSISFIGKTKEYGEQWLFSRPDFSILSDLTGKKIHNANLYLPQFNKTESILSAHKVANRFCSFGSNWNNKVDISNHINNSNVENNYQKLDVSNLLANSNGELNKNEGFIIRTKIYNCGFVAISTGDNYYKPQILEINYS